MNQPQTNQTTPQTALAVVPTPFVQHAAPRCSDPLNDRDRWVLWVMLDAPLDRYCHTLMAQLLAETYRGPSAGDPGLIWEAGEFWHYTASTGAWSILPRFRVEQRLNMWSGHLVGSGDKPRAISFTSKGKQSVLECLEIECTPKVPMFDSPARGVAFRNGFLTLDFELVPHSPTHAVRWSIPCDYDPGVERAGSLFETYWNGANMSPEQILLIGQHMFAILSGTSTHYGRAALLFGPKGSGKSQLLNMYEHLVPPGSICSVTPQQMAEDYHGAEMRGKALNVCYELSSRTPIRDEAGIKSIIQGERITRRPIRQAPVTFRPLLGHVNATNDHLEIEAPNDAFYDRWLMFRFTHSHRGAESEVFDIGRRVATEELAVLVAWVVECGRELVNTGRYAFTTEHHALIREWKHRGDSVAAWIADECEDAREDAATTWPTITDAFERFAGWCRAGNYKICNRGEFKRRLDTHGVEVARSNGTRVSLKRKA